MRIVSSFFHVDLHHNDDRNAVFLVAEIFFASIMAGASAFNAAFAVRLGASNSQIGLLSSIPALLALIVSIPAGRFLQKKAKPVQDIDTSIKKLIEDMTETMYQAPGIGLAATQVGRPVRIIVFDLNPREEGRNPSCLINPEIFEAEGEQTLEEGCLSVPEYFAEVKRNSKVKARGLDAKGKTVEICGEGVLATVLQHEIDHLDGILFLDRVGPLKRRRLLADWKKSRKGETGYLKDVVPESSANLG